MEDNNKNELDVINKKITKIKIIGYPGAFFFGLGLYGLFGASENYFLSVANNPGIVYFLTISGAFITVWEILMLIPLWKKKSKIEK